MFVWLGMVIVKGRAALLQIVRGGGDAVTPFEQAMADHDPQFAIAAVVIT